MSFESLSTWLSNFSNGLIASIVGSIFVIILGLYFFNRQRLKENIDVMAAWLRPAIRWEVLEPLNSKKQIGRIYKSLFLDVESIGSADLILMSNSGGVPEFNPYRKLLNLARISKKGRIFIAVTKASFNEWSRIDPKLLEELIEQENIQIYLFDDLTPSNYRLGVNTDSGKGFLVYNFGNDGDRNFVEGFSTENRIAVESIRRLFFALVENAEEFRVGISRVPISESEPALSEDPIEPE